MRFKNTDHHNRAVITVPTNNFTVVSLLRPEYGQTVSNYEWLFSHGTPSATNGWALGFQSDANGIFSGMAFAAHNVGVNQSTRRLFPRRWYVCGWQRDANVWKTWLDGFVDNANLGSQTPGAASGFTFLNGVFTSSTAGIFGDVMYLAMWDRVLTPVEMYYLGQRGNPRMIPGYTAMWDLSGPIPFDRTGSYPLTVNAGAPAVSEAIFGGFSNYSAVEVPSTVPEKTDSATIYIDIQVISADAYGTVDSAEVYIDIQASGSENQTFLDAATVYYDIQVESHDCLTKWDASQLFALPFERWETQANHRWGSSGATDRFIVVAGDGLEEC